MCKYCCGNIDGEWARENIFDVNIKYSIGMMSKTLFHHAVIRNGELVVSLEDNAGNYFSKESAKINYCPMCGRKLKDH